MFHHIDQVLVAAHSDRISIVVLVGVGRGLDNLLYDFSIRHLLVLIQLRIGILNTGRDGLLLINVGFG